MPLVLRGWRPGDLHAGVQQETADPIGVKSISRSLAVRSPAPGLLVGLPDCVDDKVGVSHVDVV